MKRKTVALYDPYLDVLGGGERHILSILEVLSHHDYDVTIFWDEDLTSEIHSRLQIAMPFTFTPNIFNKKTDPWKKQEILKAYDSFFYVTNGSYFFASARENYIFCMIPQKNLYPTSFFNKVKTLNYRFIANSQFTKYWLSQWGVKSEVIYPYISSDFSQYQPEKKQEKLILSVGRFFPHLHSKRHDIVISWFQDLQKKAQFKNYHLVIAGNVKKEDERYFQKLALMAKNDDHVTLMPNISYSELLGLYKKASYYWHLAGYEIDEKKHPEQVEHLGITPLEAMASGCIVCGYQAGGLRELITSHQNGFLFSTQEELFDIMESMQNGTSKKEKIRAQGITYVQEHFSYSVFEKQVLEVLHIV